MWRSDEPDHSPRRQTVDPKGQGQSFHLGSSSSCGDDPPISEEVVRRERDETSFWLLVIGLGVHRVSQIDFGSQVTPPCVRTYRRWNLRHWRRCVFSDESSFTLFHRDARVRRRQDERPIDVCILPVDDNCGPSVMVCGVIHHGGRSKLVVLD